MTAVPETGVAPRRISGDRRSHAKAVTIGLAALLVFVAVLSLNVGATGTSIWPALEALANGEDITARQRVILVGIRLPRLIEGMLVGAGLAVAGAVLQGLFRNPLADPGLVGVSAGGALGAVTAIVLGGFLPFWLLASVGSWLVPIAAFIGSWAATILLYAVSTRRGRTSVAVMLLAGIAFQALAGALTGVLIYIADDAQLRDLTFWSLGSLSGATWSKAAYLLPFIGGALAAAPFIARGLNGLALGEAAAAHLGIQVQLVKAVAILSVASAVGASVAVSGGIGFVGIVVPHLLRLAIGPDNRYLLVASGFLGAALLICADMIARVIVAPAELPIGIVTAIIGGPFFLYILLRNRGILDV